MHCALLTRQSALLLKEVCCAGGAAFKRKLARSFAVLANCELKQLYTAVKAGYC